MEDYYQILAAVLTGMVTTGAFWHFLENFLSTRKKIKEKLQLEDGLRKISNIYKRMEKMEDLGAQRVILFAGHNNGGIPRLTCGFWVSSIFSHVSEEHSDKIREYNNIPVDSTYVTTLIEAQGKAYKRYKVSEMPISQLKKYYESEGVKDSIIVFLGIHEHKFMYMSMANYDREFTSKEVTALVLEAHNIRSLFDGFK